MSFVIGVDEAGRGCVVGSLVIAAYAIEEEKLDELKKLGVKDSKLLTLQKREQIFPELLKLGKAAFVENTAEEITQLMRKRISLNEIEAMKAAGALHELQQTLEGKQISGIYVDSCDGVAKKFEYRLRKYFRPSAPLICEHHADFKYVVVGAASIVAKVCRDRSIEEIKKLVGKDFGSGYSHDERTIAFLKENIHEKHVAKHVRHTWATAKNLKQTQVKLDDFL